MKTFFKIFGFLFVFGIGFYFSWSSDQFPNSTLIVDWPRSTRDPAAIKKVYDFSHLQGSALAYATKERLLEGAKVLQEGKEISIELGHFVIRGDDGQKEFACHRFSKMILSFEGEGAAISGDLPQMEVEGQCEISQDINSMAAVWIPVSRILGEPVADGEFDFREGHPSRLKFSNVSERWPTTWRLKSIQMIDPSGTYGQISVQDEELKEMLQRPFLIQF